MNHVKILINIYILNNSNHMKVEACTNNIVRNTPSKTIYNYIDIKELSTKNKQKYMVKVESSYIWYWSLSYTL